MKDGKIWRQQKDSNQSVRIKIWNSQDKECMREIEIKNATGIETLQTQRGEYKDAYEKQRAKVKRIYDKRRASRMKSRLNRTKDQKNYDMKRV